jgi:P27 family predicted phage terminase small subunit
MGERGPAPEPRELKLVKGTYRKDRDMNCPEPEPRLPDPPDWLPEGAKEEWLKTGAELFELGLISDLDIAAFAGYCLAFDEVQQTTAIIEQEGRTFRTDKGYVGQHPAVAQRNKALLNLHKFGALFGLSPSARTRIEVPSKDNPFSKHGRREPTIEELLGD